MEREAKAYPGQVGPEATQRRSTMKSEAAPRKRPAAAHPADAAPPNKRPSTTPVLPHGPTNLIGTFQWPVFYLSVLAAMLGKAELKSLLGATTWAVATMFSGMGCPEIAISMLLAGVIAFDVDGRFSRPRIYLGPGLPNDQCRASPTTGETRVTLPALGPNRGLGQRFLFKRYTGKTEE